MKESTDKIKTLFPEEKIKFGEGEMDYVTISPLPMSRLPDAIDTFANLFEELYQDSAGALEFSVSKMAMAGKRLFVDILELLPYCIDRNLDDIPTAATPDIIRVFIRQNVLDVLKNWKALADEIGLNGLYAKGAAMMDSKKTNGGQS